MFYAIREQNIEAIEMFCDYGADLRTKNGAGYTAFTYSALLELDEIINYLSLRTKTINREDPEYLTVATRLVLRNQYDLAEKLYERGSDINYQNRLGFTPLHLAIECNNNDAVRWLISKGANPHIEDLSGEDCCDKALKYNILSIP